MMRYIEDFKDLCKKYGGDFSHNMCYFSEDSEFGYDGFKALAVWLAKRKDDLANELKINNLDILEIKYDGIDDFGKYEYTTGIDDRGAIYYDVIRDDTIGDYDSYTEYAREEYGDNVEFDLDEFLNELGMSVDNIVKNLTPPNHYLNGSVNCEVGYTGDTTTVKCESFKEFPPNMHPIPESVLNSMEKLVDTAVDKITDEANALMDKNIIRREKIR